MRTNRRSGQGECGCAGTRRHTEDTWSRWETQSDQFKLEVMDRSPVQFELVLSLLCSFLLLIGNIVQKPVIPIKGLVIKITFYFREVTIGTALLVWLYLFFKILKYQKEFSTVSKLL